MKFQLMMSWLLATFLNWEYLCIMNNGENVLIVIN